MALAMSASNQGQVMTAVTLVTRSLPHRTDVDVQRRLNEHQAMTRATSTDLERTEEARVDSE